MTCSACGRPSPRRRARGLCPLCYKRQWLAGTLDRYPRIVYPTSCTADGCGQSVHARGLCKHHYGIEHARQVRKLGWFRGIEVGA